MALCCATPLAAFEAELPEQIVTADAIGEEEAFSPGAVTIVRPKEMEGEQKSLPDLLKRVPGLHVIEARGRGAYTVASVRGSTSAQVAVYVDGVLANLGSESAVDLSTIPVSDVEAIEVYRGYVPSRFNRASMGGVINIVTKRPTSAGGRASLGASSWGGKRGALSWSTPLGDGRFYLGASAERSDGDFEYWNDNDTPYTPEDDYEARRRHNHFDRKNLLLKWEDDDWHARASWREDERGLPQPAPGFDRPSEPGPRGAWLGTRQWSLSLGRRYGSGELDWGWRAEWLDQFKEYNDPDDVTGGLGERHNEYRSRRGGFAVDASLPIGDSHLAELLIDWSNENLDVRGDVIGRASCRARLLLPGQPEHPPAGHHLPGTGGEPALHAPASVERDGRRGAALLGGGSSAGARGRPVLAGLVRFLQSCAQHVRALRGRRKHPPGAGSEMGGGHAGRPRRDVERRGAGIPGRC